MSIILGENFDFKGQRPLDKRLSYNTVAEMAAIVETNIYDGIIAYCQEDEKTYQYKASNEIDETYGKWREFKPPYLSLERLRSYLYRISFDTIPNENTDNFTVVGGGCSAYVKDGKLYRNFDYPYNEMATFNVECKGFKGTAISPTLTDGNLDYRVLAQLPYRLVDGRNDYGIMVSTHLLFNDWQWENADGEIELYKIPYIVLSNIKSLTNFSSQMATYLSNLKVPASLASQGYLLQFLVTDGTTSYAILPPTSSSGSYVIVDITSNPKLTNFRWVSDAIVQRNAQSLQTRPTGVERWNLMPCELKDIRFTKAYEAPNRLSEFIGIDGTTKNSTDAQLTVIYNEARELYLERTRNGETWQTIHSVVYSKHGMEKFFVQENFDENYGDVSIGSQNAVEYVEQTLTDAQKAQARDNIDAEKKPVRAIENVTPYIYRPTSGGSDIDGNYGLNLKSIVGGTVAFNQLVQNGDFSNGTTNWEYKSVTTQMSVDNKVATIKRIGSGLPLYLTIASAVQYKSNHKYLISCEAYSTKIISVQFQLFKNGMGNAHIAGNTSTEHWGTFSKIVKSNLDYVYDPNYYNGIHFAFQITNTFELSDEIQVKNCMCVDLTQMFGSAIADYIYSLEQSEAGAGVAWFRKYFPNDYYDYNAGELVSVKTTAHKTVGFNQFNLTTGKVNAIATTYHIKGSYTTITDSKGNTITPNENGDFTLTEATELTITGGDSTTCINISHSGYRDNDFEPYEEHTYPFEEKELRGIYNLDSSNNLIVDGDIYNSDGSISRKYRLRKMKDMTWSTTSETNMRFRAYTGDAAGGAMNTINNILCNRYVTVSAGSTYTGNIGISVSGETTKIVHVCDAVYATVEDFVASLTDDDYIIYELETPTTETATPFAEYQVISDFGTEQFIFGQNTLPLPVGHDSVYVSNPQDKLQRLPDLPEEVGDFITHYNGEKASYKNVNGLFKTVGGHSILGSGDIDPLEDVIPNPEEAYTETLSTLKLKGTVYNFADSEGGSIAKTTNLLKGDGDGNAIGATEGVDYQAPIADIETIRSQAGNAVPSTRKVNDKALSSDITLSASDIPTNQENVNVQLSLASKAGLILSNTFTGTNTFTNAIKTPAVDTNNTDLILKRNGTDKVEIKDQVINVLTNLNPKTNNQVDVGGMNYKWKDIYFAGSLKDGTNSISVSEIAKKSEIPTKTSDLINDSGFITASDIPSSPVTSVNGKTGAVVLDGNDIHINGSSSGLLKDVLGQLREDVDSNTENIEGIVAVIPEQATESNQLADKAFVNSSIATNTGSYIYKTNGQGQKLPFDSLAELQAYSGTLNNNDYAFVKGTDTAGNTTYTRYKYVVVEGQIIGSWAQEYVLNNSSFTATQWASINSGITSGDVSKITQIEQNLANNYYNKNTIDTKLLDYQSKIDNNNKLSSDLVDDTNKTNKFVTTADKTTWNNKYSKPSTGIPKTDLASTVQTSLGKADTAYQKQSTGIPYNDLSSDVKSSLDKADGAIQEEDTDTIDITSTPTSGSTTEVPTTAGVEALIANTLGNIETILATI